MTKDNFHSQFKLSMDEYRDNNNFLRHNLVTTNDFRLPWQFKTETFKFLDVQSRPFWIGQVRELSYNISYDLGETFKPSKERIVFGTFFFVSNERRVLTR